MHYHFYAHKPCPWVDIENDFRKYFGGLHTQMVDLIRHIRNSGAAGRLFAYASMDKLVVSNDFPIDPRKDALHIRFDRPTERWHFCYFGVPFRPAEFERIYPAESGIEKFDLFMKMVRW